MRERGREVRERGRREGKGEGGSEMIEEGRVRMESDHTPDSIILQIGV